MKELLAFLRDSAQGDLLPWCCQREAMELFGRSAAEIESLALGNGLLPARYQRNRAMLSLTQQQRLFGCYVVVVGCGGLGGHVLEQLARLGVGRIRAIDPDVFDEHNLNRQLLSSIDNLGHSKVVVAAERVSTINPAVTIDSCQQAFGADNGEELLMGADLVMDCLDNIKVRHELAEACNRLGVPLVHGAIAGWYGHVSTVFPGDSTLEWIYPCRSANKGIEQNIGNPSFTPALVASLEVAEACKVLLSQGEPLRNRLLSIDLREMDFEQVGW